MIKKLFGSAVAAGLLAVSSVAATAAPVAFERAASPVGEAENLDGVSDVWLVALFAALAAAIIIAVESGEDDSLPVSP